MTARVLHLVGAALVLAVLLAAAAVMAAVCLPVLLVAGMWSGLVELVRTLKRRGEMSRIPDAATPQLARRLDDGADLGDVLSHPDLPCGCSLETTAYTCPRKCGWRACVVHLHSTHYCDPVPDIAVVNDRFARLINGPELRGLRRAPESLAPYYLIGDEK